MKKIVLAIIAFAATSGFLFGGQIKNFVELKKALEQGKLVFFISKVDRIDPDTEKRVIKEVGVRIEHFSYDGEAIRTFKEILLSNGNKCEILIFPITFRKDDSVSIEVNAFDSKTKKEAAATDTYEGKINNGDNSGIFYLHTIE